MTTAKAKQENTRTEEFEQAKQAALEAYNNFLEAQKHLKAAAYSAGNEARDTASEQFDESMDKLDKSAKDLSRKSSRYIKRNPLSSAGMAFVAGFFISRILR